MLKPPTKTHLIDITTGLRTFNNSK